jgi:uncharacterized protein YkwD
MRHHNTIMRRSNFICWVFLLAIMVDYPAFAGPPGTAYSIGQPTAKEQLYVEHINRARANPTAEGIRLAGYNTSDPAIASAYNNFSVNLTTMQAEFVTGSANGKPTLNVAEPLSINPQLMNIARAQSQDMITYNYQGHTSNAGQGIGARATAAGYAWNAIGENVFANSIAVLYGHAGFNVDWGGSDGTGMQGPPRGHRANLHNTTFNEIGVGNLTSVEATIPASNTNTKGPEVITQDLGRSGARDFITGVVYYDLNGNNFYDLGEGIGGVEVGVTGSTFKGVTANTGGYSVPVPGNGTYPMTFWFPGAAAANYSTTCTISGNLNQKVDWLPTYTAPTLSGPASPTVNMTNSYDITAVGGATGYELISGPVQASPAVENADVGNAGYTLEAGTNGHLAVEAGGVTGSAFHFSNNTGASTPTLTLTRMFVPRNASAVVNFSSRLRAATSAQIAYMELRLAGSNTWTSLWSQAGSGSPGETSYSTRAVTLSAYVGRVVELRWVYRFSTGSYFTGVSASVGWYVDNISLLNTDEITPNTITTLASNAASFQPTVTGNHVLAVKAKLSDPLYPLPYGAALNVNVINATGYAAWSYTATVGAFDSDYDKDGIPNGAEYAFNTVPTVAQGQSVLPAPVLSGGYLTLSYTQPPGVSGVTYGAEWSDNLTSWTNISDSGTGNNHIFSIGTSGQTKRFVRWKITLQ